MLQLENLNVEIRALMLEEATLDIDSGNLYFSERFNDLGRQSYPALLCEAIQHGDDEWLAHEIDKRGMLKTHEQRRTPKGGYTTVKVPVGASRLFAEGEFNRFYLRAICRYALDVGGMEIEIYRAKDVSEPRPDSEARIGSRINPGDLLADLRANTSLNSALRLPQGPNSGLSGRLVTAR